MASRAVDAPEALPAFDEAAWQGAQTARRAEYADYLLSTGWQMRRQLVMARQRWICEGCGSARAVDIHHLTYAHFGNELLFELVALCRPCHIDIAHGPSLNGDDAELAKDEAGRE